MHFSLRGTATALFALLAVPVVVPRLAAQQPRTRRDSTAVGDTSRARALDPVVVTATRSGAALTTAAASVTQISGESLRRLPVRTISDALANVPGMIPLQQDGLGFAPRLIVRGFSGGGETDYAALLIDGVPATEMVTGLVDWDLVPLRSIRSIEIIRGGASPLYGDAAIGGVVNVLTQHDRTGASWQLGGGEFGQRTGSLAIDGKVGSHRADIFGDVRRSSGYRDHEKRSGSGVGGSISLIDSPTNQLTLSTLNHWRNFDEPGALADSAASHSARGVSPFYRFDNTGQRVNRLSLSGSSIASSNVRVTGYFTGEAVRTAAVRTLPLTPDFADTKERQVRTSRLLGSIQAEISGTAAGLAQHLIIGTDLGGGQLSSDYYNIITGGAGDYASATGEVGDIDTRGRGTRTDAAAFAHWEGVAYDIVRLSVGGRMDWINDHYEPRAPSDGDAQDVHRSAFSPRVGLNVRYANSARQTGSIYVTAGRSFKAPTIDQLFDQRRTPVDFPPYAISTSNPLLESQYGKSGEIGAYHQITLVPSQLDARISVSGYQTDMRNELDFDFATFRYVNVGRSRHRGLEASIDLRGANDWSAFGNLTAQRITSRVPEDSGHQLKAIPGRVIAAGISRAPATGLAATVTVSNIGDSYLDDANTVTLPGHTQVDLRASYPVRRVRVFADVRNLFDSHYNSTGYPDPAGGPLVYYYPAAGRALSLGLESRW